MCRDTILSKRGNTVISWCVDCEMITIWHNSTVLIFLPGKFLEFKYYVDLYDFIPTYQAFPDGTCRLLLCIPPADIAIALTIFECGEFLAALEEAEFMTGVYKLIAH